MSRPVYSTRFIAGFAPSVAGSYTVPAGFVAIVRDIDAWHEAGGSGSDYLYASVVSLGGAFFYETFAASQWISWRGRQVINPGEELVVQGNSTVNQSVMVSGYLLMLP